MSAIPPTTRSIAVGALRQLKKLDDWEEARDAADEYLRQIADGGNDEEKILAQATRSATSESLAHESANRAQEIALTVLAGGINGPISQVVAEIASDAMEAASDAEDQRTLGSAFLKTIGQQAECEPARVLAETARTATSSELTDDSAVDAQWAALDLIRESGSKPLPELLVRMGVRFHEKATDDEDARTLGGPVLDALQKHASHPDQKLLASTAREASRVELYDNTAAKLQRIGFDMLAKSPTDPPLHMMIEYSALALDAAQDAEEQRAMGTPLLATLAAVAPEPQHRLVAVTGSLLADQRLYDHTAAGIVGHTIGMLDGDVPRLGELALAQLGQAAVDLACEDEERCELGHAVLDQIASTTTDDDIRQTAEAARDLPQKAKRNWLDRIPGVKTERLKARQAVQAFKQKQAIADLVAQAETLSATVAEKKESERRQQITRMADAVSAQPRPAERVRMDADTVMLGKVRVARNVSTM